MRTAKWWMPVAAMLACAAPVLLGTGCSWTAPGEIPLGQWSGDGVFVYEDWHGQQAAKNESDAGDKSIHRHYAARLHVAPSELDGHDIIEMNIHSDRGSLPQLGDGTHLRLALVKVKDVSPAIKLYRLVDVQFNPKPGEQLKFDESAPPYSASCVTQNGSTVLIIQYADNFVDTYRFRGNRLEKSGTYFNLDEGMIQWDERLRRSR